MYFWSTLSLTHLKQMEETRDSKKMLLSTQQSRVAKRKRPSRVARKKSAEVYTEDDDPAADPDNDGSYDDVFAANSSDSDDDPMQPMLHSPASVDEPFDDGVAGRSDSSLFTADQLRAIQSTVHVSISKAWTPAIFVPPLHRIKPLYVQQLAIPSQLYPCACNGL